MDSDSSATGCSDSPEVTYRSTGESPLFALPDDVRVVEVKDPDAFRDFFSQQQLVFQGVDEDWRHCQPNGMQ